MKWLDRSVLTVSRRPTISIFLYVARAVEQVLAVAFGNKLCWFESHYRHISLCSPGSWTCASSSLQKQTLLVWVPLSAYFLCSQGSWTCGSSSLQKQTMLVSVPLLAVAIQLKTFTAGNSWACKYDGCAWDPGWFCSHLVSGVWLGEWNTVGKCAAVISAFKTSS